MNKMILTIILKKYTNNQITEDIHDAKTLVSLN